MSLQIWLPLNGDLHNQGLKNVTITNNGATIDNNGKIGKCYYFNRSAPNYLKIDNPITTATNGVSMAFWIKISSNASGNNQIIHIGNGAGWNNSRCNCFINKSSSSLVFSCSNGGGTGTANSTQYGCKSSALTLNKWTHVVCIYSTGIMKIYLNGVLDKEYTTSIVPSFTGVSYIGVGAAPNANEPATGYMNDVRVYDHALSQKEVEEISKGLVLWYQLNSTNVTYSNIYDSSGYRNNGTIVGSLITSTGSPRYDVATNFSNFTNYITTPSLGLTECSYSMWVKPSADTTVGVVFSDYLSGMCFGRGESYVYCHHNTAALNPNKRYIRSTITNDDTWQHFVICRTATGEINLYKNGELVSPNHTSASGFNHYETDQLLIGRRIGANQSDNTAYSIKGDIVDFREYATILTPAQVKELYLTSMIVNANGTTSPRELVN